MWLNSIKTNYYIPKGQFKIMLELLKTICEVPGVSGREHNIAAKIKEILTPYVDEVRIDNLGNVIGVIRGTAPADKKKKLMFSAHMDEVGFMVTKVDDNGYMHAVNIGGPNMISASYREVVFDNGCRGMLVPTCGNDGAGQVGKCVVDVGAKNKEEAEKVAMPGDTFTVAAGIIPLCGTRYAGHPVDDRIGCAILIDAARILSEGERPANDIFCVFSVQEEINGNGGLTAAYQEMPDYGIAIDVCGVGDMVGSDPMVMKLGDGAAIKVKDSTIMCDWDLVKRMFKLAEENNIKYQREILLAGGTDATSMQKVAMGIKAGCISIPMRYLHTSAEAFDMEDAVACRDLTVAMCRDAEI